jgi:hypothetical protein
MPRPRPARAAVRNLDTTPAAAARDADVPAQDWRLAVAAALRHALGVLGWSVKVGAGKVGVDASEFGKWTTGARRPHVDKLLCCEELRTPLLLALNALDVNVEVVTEIRVRHTWRGAATA